MLMNITPFVKTPFTDLVGSICTHQFYGRCPELEMKMMTCLEAYGTERGKVKCSDIIEDFNECSLLTKQIKRMNIMVNERKRQYKSGELSEEERYAAPPKMDSY